MSSNKLLHAGQFDFADVEILQAGGLAISIIDQVQQINIYEDLFSPFISGNMIIKDTISLPTLLLNAGADLLRLRLGTPTLPKDKYIDRYFHIYKLSDRVVINERACEFMFHFVSQESLVDSSISISKTFKGKAEDNISEILTKHIKTKTPFKSSSTTNEVNYTSNFWSPMKNIVYNADHANNATYGPTMVFFENRDGFNFKSIQELGSAEPYMKFEASNHISDVGEDKFNGGVVTKNLDKDYKNVLSLSAPMFYDYMKNKTDGGISTRMFTFDFVTKKITDTTFDQTKLPTKMNPNRFYKEQVIKSSYQGSDSSILIPNTYKHYSMYTDKGDVTDARYKQHRITALRNIQQHKVEITVFGRTDYTVGKCVHLDVNKLLAFNRGITSKQIEDPLITGKYVISAICHIFTRDGKHQSVLELIRDSIGKAK